MAERGIMALVGAAQFAQLLPDKGWYEIKFRIRRVSRTAAEVYVCDEVENVSTGEIIEIEIGGA